VANDGEMGIIPAVTIYYTVDEVPQQRGACDEIVRGIIGFLHLRAVVCQYILHQIRLIEQMTEIKGPAEAFEAADECSGVADEDDNAAIEAGGEPGGGEDREGIFEEGALFE